MKTNKDKDLNKIINEWNKTQTDYPRNSSVIDVFEKTVVLFPNRPALSYKNEEITYEKLNDKVNQLVCYLQKNINFLQHKFIGISIERSVDYIIGILAILKCGGVYIPLDASYPEETLKYIINDSKIDLIITQNDMSDKFPDKKIKLISLNEIELALSELNTVNLEFPIDPMDIAYINYTSGSTGTPKGVKVPHRGIVRLVKNTNWMKISEKDRMLHASNNIFDVTTLEVWGALLNGACLCIYHHKNLIPSVMAKFLKDEKITQIHFSAKFFNLMIDNEIESLTEVRCLFSTGEAMSVKHAKKAFSRLSRTKIGNCYGPTENTVYTTSYIISSIEDIEKEVPIGKPISNTFTYILDKNLNPVPIGEVGELCTGGDGVAKGYLNKKELTDKVFVMDPFSNEKGSMMYKTGDLASYQPDGNVLFRGRFDSQVKIRGFRIELGAIESEVKKNKNVRDCVCVVSEEIEGEKQLALYVEVSGMSKEKLTSFISLHLPKNMIPDFIIIMENLPLTPTGKIDRKILAHPRKILREMNTETTDSSSVFERLIMKIWGTILKLEKINREDNYFHIGGNSINAVELICLLSDHFKMEFSSGLIFEEQVLKDFSKKIEELISARIRTKKEKQLSKFFFVRWRDQEVFLDSLIGKENLPLPVKEQFTDPKNVFLTGSTGLVGAFVLQMLLKNTNAKIYCLTRANATEEGYNKIILNMEKYGIWNKVYRLRIIPIIGDLGKKLMGIAPNIFSNLAEIIDSVFHIGASTHHMFSYNQLKSINVEGTKEAIFLALHKKNKIFQYISTIDVFEAKGTLYEEDDLEKSEKLANGYAQSKWVAEKIVKYARERGLYANIFRLSRILGSSENGSGPTSDFIWQMVQAVIYLKAFPDIEIKENMEPVDFVAQAIVGISKEPDEINKEYHLFSPKMISIKTVFKALQLYGYPLLEISYKKWRKELIDFCRINKKSHICGLVPLFSEDQFINVPSDVKFDCKNSLHVLKKTFWPNISYELIKLYLDYYVKIGFLPKPPKKS